VRLTPRRRLVIGCVAMVLIGFFARSIYRGIDHGVNCNSAVISATNSCSFGVRHFTVFSYVLMVVLVALTVGLAVVISNWALRPVRALTEMVRRLGPQNLAERSPVVANRDETSQLAGALNDMMDRLAAGYEGQRSFAANASHELRTPLAVQRTLIEVSMAGARTPDQLELLTEQLLATNERNERLIEGLLVLSESDRGLVSRTPQQLDQIAGMVVDAHRDLAAKSAVTLVAELTPCVVLGEQVLLERLVTNLVRNAILYNVSGGDVLIRVGVSPSLVVENTGTPIPAESISGLFEPFRRGTTDRTHHGGGAGLGLTIVRSICAAHDGTVDARPGQNGGLRVEVSLPSTR
jgi:signal transduction histidine kinase